jgi:trk system potassium uptake protein TrkA
MPGLIEKLPFEADIIIREITVEGPAQKTLREIDLTNRYNVQIVAIQKQGQSNYKFIPRADDQLVRGDKIIAIGDAKTLANITL